MIVLGEGNFWFRFGLFIQFLALWSMDEKAEANHKLLSPSAINDYGAPEALLVEVFSHDLLVLIEFSSCVNVVALVNRF